MNTEDLYAELDGIEEPGQLSRGTLLNLFGAANGLFLENEKGEETAAAALSPRAVGPIYYTTELPRVFFGEVEAQVVFSGLAPGLKGVWQISVVVPERAPTVCPTPFSISKMPPLTVRAPVGARLPPGPSWSVPVFTVVPPV